jgi:hypothetical protein
LSQENQALLLISFEVSMHRTGPLMLLLALCGCAAYYGRRPGRRFSSELAIIAAVVILFGVYVVRS